MNQRLIQLAERRERLLMRAAQQRMVLSHDLEPWRHLLARADQGLDMVRYVKGHPLWLAGGGVVLLAVLGPGRLWTWFGRGVVAWQMMHRLRL